MQTAEQQALATPDIGKYYPTAIVFVSRGRYTYTTSDLKASGHFTEPNERKFRRALTLEIYSLNRRGYFVKLQTTNIEG
ncbi:MAG: hypothetical protein ACKPCM_15310 [Pseudanabaena sp.]